MPYRNIYRYKFDILIFLSCFFVLALALRTILGSEILAGWDMPGHYYLYNKMIESLGQGRISSYDPAWYAGYPAFKLYPPFFYFALASIYYLCFGLIEPVLIFNLAVFLLPFLLIISVYWTSKVYFNTSAARISVWLTLLTLFLGREYSHYNLGLPGQLYIGSPANSLALPLFVILIGLLKKISENTKYTSQILLMISLIAIICTHILSAIFTFWILIVFISLNLNLWKRLLPAIILAVLITSFWWVDFVKYLPFSSGSKLTANFGPEHLSTPLFLLFPGLFFYPKIYLFGNFENLSQVDLNIWGLDFSLTGYNWFVCFPFVGILLFCGFLGALYQNNKINAGWLIKFIILSVVLLSGDFFLKLTDLEIHYYRFIQFLLIINIIISASGLAVIYEKIRSGKNNIVKYIAFSILILVIPCSVSFAYFFGFSWSGNNGYSKQTYQPAASGLRLKDFSYNIQAKQMIEYIANLQPQGRILIESTQLDSSTFGSAHFFTSLLPLKTNLEVLPGLLGESALSAGFINPALGKISNQFVWGRDRLSFDSLFSSLEVQDYVQALKLYGVKYILTISNKLKNNLSGLSDLKVIRKIGVFSLYEIKETEPLFKKIAIKPWLYINLGSKSFREFSEDWFKFPELYNYPLIESNKAFDRIDPAELSQIGGFVVYYDPKTIIDNQELEKWGGVNKKINILNGKISPAFIASPKITVIPDYSLPENKLKWAQQFITLQEHFDTTELVHVTADFKNQIIKFDAIGGVAINYNYSPGWVSTKIDQTIYMLSPTKMFVFANGLTELKHSN